MSFRKEKKFRTTNFDLNRLKQNLFFRGMQPLHPKRKISSVYFDNTRKQMFLDSEEGVLPRKKIRVRWYDDDKKFTQETKVSSIEGRYKKSKFLNGIHSEEDTFRMKLIDFDYGIIKPVLKISYYRNYYQLQKLRITFDQKISFTNLANLGNKNLFFDPEGVIEIKASIDCGDDYIEDVLGNPTERFSKYCRGILMHEGQL